jgi:DNA-binding XRE family transcriptional regulator
VAVAMFRAMLQHDRKRSGFTVGQVAWRLGVSPQEYRELVDGERYPNFETWDRMCKLFGWPQTFSPTASNRTG